MKTIKFGYSNDTNPRGSWQGLGISEEMHLYEANYIGAVKIHNDSYVVVKIVDDKYKTQQVLLNTFIVRPALADMYADGSGTIYLDQEQSNIGRILEDFLNNPQVINKISDIKDVMEYFGDAHIADRVFTYLTLEDEIIATSIKHNEFEKKNNAIKGCRKPFSELNSSEELYVRNSFTK